MDSDSGMDSDRHHTRVLHKEGGRHRPQAQDTADRHYLRPHDSRHESRDRSYRIPYQPDGPGRYRARPGACIYFGIHCGPYNLDVRARRRNRRRAQHDHHRGGSGAGILFISIVQGGYGEQIHVPGGLARSVSESFSVHFVNAGNRVRI